MKIFLTLLLTLSFSFAMNDFRNVPKEKIQLLQEGKNKMYCPVCGMTLPFFYKTNHAAHDGKKQNQYCSIVCMAEDEIANNKKLNNYQVVDANTYEWIDSKNAYFVVGSSKPGTMSHISKYAFSNEKEAQTFAKENGGEIMKFDALFKRVSHFLSKEIEETRKKQAMAAKKGEMMYNKFCNKTDAKFASIADAKSYIVEHKLCGELEGKKLQAIGIYLFKR